MAEADTPRVGDIGEFGLIDRLARILKPLATDALVGIGDDTAVLAWDEAQYLLATTDMLVEGVHFLPDMLTMEELGRRAMSVNVSDIAAMGGTPTYALISLAVPPETPVLSLEDLYRGLTRASCVYGVSIVGGNVARLDGPLVVDLMLLGTVQRGDVLLRSGARAGDAIAVTGELGGAAAALALSRSGGTADGIAEAERLARRRRVPSARLHAGQIIARSHLAHAMMDLSDGLAGDLAHLTRASEVGAVVDKDLLPIDPCTKAVAARLGLNVFELALSGGEDYELLVALPPENLEAVNRALGDAGEVLLTAVGHVTDELGCLHWRHTDGQPAGRAPAGFTHF